VKTAPEDFRRTTRPKTSHFLTIPSVLSRCIYFTHSPTHSLTCNTRMARHSTRMLLLLVLPWACSGFTTTSTTSPALAVLAPRGRARPEGVETTRRCTARGGLAVVGRRPRCPAVPSSQMPYGGDSYYSSPVALAAHATDALEDTTTRSSGKRAWHVRIWSRLRRSNSRQTSSQPLRMQVIDAETEALLDSVTSYYQAEYGPNATPRTGTTTSSSSSDAAPISFGDDDFILRNFEEFAPQSVLSGAPEIDAEFFNVKTTTNHLAVAATPKVTTTSSLSTSSPTTTATTKVAFVSRWLGMLFENILTGIIQRNAKEAPEGLRIQAFPKGNAMAALLRGRFQTDAEIDVSSRLVFPAIRISSGRLEIQRLTLQIWGFLGQQQQGNDDEDAKVSLKRTKAATTTTRFPKQFDFHAHDWTFSRHDLLLSPCIRNGLRLLLVRILRDRGVKSSSIQVTSLDILVRNGWMWNKRGTDRQPCPVLSFIHS
jgi:hypothetical protein